MKIGIITFHRAYNYGAFMQCYSLADKLARTIPEAKVEVIDYASKNMLHSYHLTGREKIFGIEGSPNPPSCALIIKRIVRYVLEAGKRAKNEKQNEQRQINFDSSVSSFPLSQNALVSDSPKKFEQLISNQYDILVVGSDAIWNDTQTSIPNLYYLHDIRNCRKYSYAASTYGMDYANKTQEELLYIKEALRDFEYIGVRDSASEAYVNFVCQQPAMVHHTCDPSVFLDLESLPIDMYKLKEKLIRHGVRFDKPIIGMMCGEWLAKYVRKYFGKQFQLVSVYTYTESADVFLDDLTPFEWARVFAFFDATVTHYFHGTLFSIKNGTLTYPVERASLYSAKYETKIQDVMKRLHLYEEFYHIKSHMTDIIWKDMAEFALNHDHQEIRTRLADAITQESKSACTFFEALKKELDKHGQADDRRRDR